MKYSGLKFVLVGFILFEIAGYSQTSYSFYRTSSVSLSIGGTVTSLGIIALIIMLVGLFKLRALNKNFNIAIGFVLAEFVTQAIAYALASTLRSHPSAIIISCYSLLIMLPLLLVTYFLGNGMIALLKECFQNNLAAKIAKCVGCNILVALLLLLLILLSSVLPKIVLIGIFVPFAVLATIADIWFITTIYSAHKQLNIHDPSLK